MWLRHRFNVHLLKMSDLFYCIFVWITRGAINNNPRRSQMIFKDYALLFRYFQSLNTVTCQQRLPSSCH